MGQFQWLKNKKDLRLKSMSEHSRQKCYNSGLWKNTSSNYKKIRPLCELCLLEDKVTPVQEVHHYIKFNDQSDDVMRYALLTDSDNLISVCSACHHSIHQSPEELTDNQRLHIQEKKEMVFQKYLLKGQKIIFTDDINGKPQINNL